MTHFPKIAFLSLATIMGLGAPSAAIAADSVEIRNFIGFVDWANGPASAQVLENAGHLTIEGQDELLIDGGFRKLKSSDCESTYGRLNVNLLGLKKEGRFGGYENLDEYPVLKITFPANAELILQNSILFTKGEPSLRHADLNLDYCGDVTLGDIEGQLILTNRGSADISAKSVGQLNVDLFGSGDLTAGDVKVVKIKSKGSGDVELGNLESLDMNLHGSGGFEADNVGGDANLNSYGSGDVELNHLTGSFTYSGHGSGDFEVASIKGLNASLRTQGSGSIEIDGGQVNLLTIVSRGSGSVIYDGRAQTAKLKSNGSGDIQVEYVQGGVEIQSSGSGDVDVEKRG